MSTVLILALAKTLGGLSVAGMTTQHDQITGLRWVRPTRERGPLQMSDLTTGGHRVLRPFDVVEIELLRPQPIPPLIETWIADFDRGCPRILRRLTGEKRRRFLQSYCDPFPSQVLEGQQRSLCLVRAESVAGSFRRRAHAASIDAHLRFEASGRTHSGSYVKGGLAVTDLQWLALGETWLPEGDGWTEFDEDMLNERYGIQETYLVVGLDRSDQYHFEPIIIGVHTAPEYQTSVAAENP